MKILYGINGYGNGHLTRSRIMAKELSKAGIDVTYLFSGRDKDKYFDMEPFGSNVIFKKGLTFAIENGKVDLWKTYKNNDVTTLLKDIDFVDLSSFDLIISDFEPITAWAAKLQEKYSIGIGHQYAFLHNIPRSNTNFIVQWIMNNYAPVSYGLGLHWHHFNQPILPPIIELLKPSKNIKNKIVVYLPFENLSSLISIFSQFKDYQFEFYTREKPVDKLPSNLLVNDFSKDKFLKDLKSCNGVICNAGFELASEAIHLNKKILVKPVIGQMEQHCNATALVNLKYGQSMDTIDINAIRQWLDTENESIQPTYCNVAKHIVDWLKVGNKDNFPFDKVWKKVKV
jgi:uncharacterized protein (TIGR00661 family)